MGILVKGQECLFDFEIFCILVTVGCILVFDLLKYGDYRIYLCKAGETMIIKTEHDLSCNDIEVLIRFAKGNKRVERLITLIQSFDTRIKCKEDNIWL